MKLKSITILLICAVLLTTIPALVGAHTTGTVKAGITLVPANGEKTSWAYYPYDPAKPFTGGKWSPQNGGTASMPVKNGTDIYRKLTVVNNGANKTSVTFRVSGLPSTWTVLVSHKITNLAPGKTGYGHIIVKVPTNAKAGTYPYTIKATTGNNTSTITDKIIVK